MSIYWPCDPALISYGFGYPPGYGGFHNGIDFGLQQGTTLFATAAGVAKTIDAGTKDGWGIDITTADGTKVRFWHVSKFLIPNGSTVVPGQTIGLSGGAKGTPGAGNSTGAHLHYGIMKNNAWVDPATQNLQIFSPTPEDEEMPNSQYFVALSDSPSGVVKANEVWVRPAPGEPLHFLTAGQAHDWFAMNGLDFNSPNVFGKEGGWYDLAFQEDNTAAQKNAEARKVK